MKLKAYKTTTGKRALRVTLVSDYLDTKTLVYYRTLLDCVLITKEIFISFYIMPGFPNINIDEYFAYIDLMDIDISILSKAREESFPVLIEILETKYGIEYVDAED